MVRIIAFLLALAALQFAAFAQSLPDTGRAADAAEAVAARAAGTFEPIDPDNEMPAADDAAAVYAGLPPLSGAIPAAAPAPVAAEPAMAAEIEDMADIDADAPRGPAVRMISNPVVQALPAQAPAPVAKPAALAPAPKPAPSGGGFVIKSILPIEGTIRYGDWFWDESAAPASGPLVITVDLDARVIS